MSDDLQRYLPPLTPGAAIELPDGFLLRSLTINPIIVGNDDVGRNAGALAEMLSLRRRPSEGNRHGVVWIELQITTTSFNEVSIPPVTLRLSKALGEAADLSWIRSKLFGSQAIINSTVPNAGNADLEAGYGKGAMFPDTRGKYLAIERPYYGERLNAGGSKVCCKFAVAICRSVTPGEQRCAAVRFELLPVSSDERTPLVENCTIKLGESVAVWVPIRYPSSMIFMAGDDKYCLSLALVWTRSDISELFSFPRMSSVYRLNNSTPHFSIIPTLPNDPLIWRSFEKRVFAMRGEISDCGSNRYGEAAILLELENTEMSERRQLKQIWVSILAGVVVSSLFGVMLNWIDTHGASAHYWIIATALIALMITAWSLLPSSVEL